jgi:hypothetical protein
MKHRKYHTDRGSSTGAIRQGSSTGAVRGAVRQEQFEGQFDRSSSRGSSTGAVRGAVRQGQFQNQKEES